MEAPGNIPQVDTGIQERSTSGLHVVVENPIAIFNAFAAIDITEDPYAVIQQETIHDPLFSGFKTVVEYNGGSDISPRDATHNDAYTFISTLRTNDAGSVPISIIDGYFSDEQEERLRAYLDGIGCYMWDASPENMERNIFFEKDLNIYNINLGYRSPEDKRVAIEGEMAQEKLRPNARLFTDQKFQEGLLNIHNKDFELALVSCGDGRDEVNLDNDFRVDLDSYAATYENVLKGFYRVCEIPEPDRTFVLQAEQKKPPQLRLVK